MSAYAFNTLEIEHYRTEGYVVAKSVFRPEELRKIYKTIEEVTQKAMASEDYSSVLEVETNQVNGQYVPRRIYDPFDQHEIFRSVGTDPRILDRIESLISPDIGLQHSKLNMKPARVGSVVEWHQDLTYFPHTNDDLVSTLVYLDDATEDNGCLQVLPRHHHHFFNHTDTDGMFAGMITEDLSDGRFGKPQPLPAPAGSIIFMHCITPHSSLPNRSISPRRTLIFEYRAADSFPIYFSDLVAESEKKAHHLRGRPANFSRFGGPPQFIPTFPKTFRTYSKKNSQGSSGLYNLQQDSRQKLSRLKT